MNYVHTEKKKNSSLKNQHIHHKYHSEVRMYNIDCYRRPIKLKSINLVFLSLWFILVTRNVRVCNTLVPLIKYTYLLFNQYTNASTLHGNKNSQALRLT